MPVDKFGRRGIEDKSDVSVTFLNNSFVRRDGGNTVTGSIDMTGNSLSNVGDPSSDKDVATKAYVDSRSVADKVSKSGDTMTGNLEMNVGSDTARLLGCLDLTEGKSFSVALGNSENQLQFDVKAPSEAQTPVTMETSHGFLVKTDGVGVIQFDRSISAHRTVSMNNNRITNLPEPSTGQEPATKYYVDSRKPLITVWAEENEMIETGTFEWSFGSGASGRWHRRSGYPMMVSGRIIRMGLAGCESGFAVRFDAKVNIVVNGREKTDYSITMPSGSFSASSIFTVPLELHQNDRINFKSASSNPDITSAVVSLLIELDL